MNQYWSNLDQSLNDLVRDGFCYLPPIQDTVDLEGLAKRILDDVSENVYSSGIKSHIEFCNEFGITNILASKLYTLAKDNFNYKGSIDNQYHIARKVEPGLVSESYRGHFDSHLFTLVLPVQIPKKLSDESVGDLIFSPRSRNIPKNEFFNFIQKAYFKKYASKEGFNRLSKNKKVIQEDFSSYRPLLFIGLSTFHANLAVNQILDKDRITLLSHFFDPSPPWGVGAMLRKIRNR